MASDIKKSEWLRCDLFPNRVWSVVRRRAAQRIVMELYGRKEQPDASIPVPIEPNLCLWTGRVTHVVPGLVRPNHQGECSFTVHTEDSIVTFFARNEKTMIEWVNLIRRMLPKNDNEYTTGRAAVSRAPTASAANRTTEASAPNGVAVTSADLNTHYGHISGATVAVSVPAMLQPNHHISAAQPMASETSAPSPAPQSSVQRPRAAPVASNSTRDPTSPLPPTPDLSESVYGAVYPAQPQREAEAPAQSAAARGGQPDALYGHLSQCSSAENRSGWDRYAQSLLGRVWPLSWWKAARK